ncbi:WD repeat-containing protein 49-like isoform X3 [Mercenaria mercenaria]|uniref:WD repeat-containing protein 49-like isoform X3 n=1 Tax=Mercenaria mercenaria TaxID=6596 RepID=UPI00234EE846|nr:WD repeat-containing protein 49-like isoform X3 [Mercenaria mercenaria]
MSLKTASPTRSSRADMLLDGTTSKAGIESSRTPERTDRQERNTHAVQPVYLKVRRQASSKASSSFHPSRQPLFKGKVVTMDTKIENRLNMKDLDRLQDAFMNEGDGYDNKLSLNKEQFCEALSILLNKGSREEYGELFDKIDVTREGTVDWDKFASHMLLEFYEKDDRVKSTQVPQWKDLKHLPSPHKELIQRVAFLKNTNRYIAISKEGTISSWGVDMKLQRALKTGTDSCKARDLWVTYFVVLHNVNKIALAFTSKEIAIYDLSSKVEFSCQYKVQNLQYTPLSLDYWSNPMNPNEAILVFGDVGGYVNALFFNSAQIALFERPPAPAGEKQETCLNVDLHHIAIGKYKNVTYTKYQAHIKEWARQVKYSHYLECFISCATSSTRSVMIGWMEKHTSVNQPTKHSWRTYIPGSATSKKEIQRTSSFTIQQGVNAFDFSDQLNLIATAGVNHHVCLWNPYVVSKPNGILRGHMASVVQVQFIKSRGQLISFSKDKVLRIWDVQLQVCIQRLAGMFPKGPEVYSSLFFDEGKDRHGVERNRLFISFNYQLTLMEMKAEIKDRIMSHEKPVVAALYNSVYNQVVSVCQAGTMVMWMIDTGQKVKQFNGCHGSAEVTCLTQDSTETRLLTASTDGTVKIWDFNGHCYHTLDCSGGQPADIGQVLSLKRSVLAVGWAKYVTVFRDTSFREFHVLPSDWKGGQEHTEDVLCAAFMPPNILATGSYDGEIVIWNTNSEHSSRHLTQRMKKRTKSRSSTFVTKTRENTNVSMMSRKASRASLHSRGSGTDEETPVSEEKEQQYVEENEYSWAISKLLFLEARKGNSASGCANLVSCGGNGIVRFWNSSHNTLMAEFTAHQHAGSIIMASDKNNQYLVTGDVDGVLKVWEILEYATHSVDQPITEQPPLRTQFQPHQDMINTLELCERNERLIIISASSDCSVSLWDVHGNRIGTFGQEEHWKIEPYSHVEEFEEFEEKEEEEEDIEMEVESDHDSEWAPDPLAVENPNEYRVDTWQSTHLGKEYQETRRGKRQRQQPGTIPDLAYLHWERTGAPPSGPYSALDIPELNKIEQPTKPDPDKYFFERPSSVDKKLPKLPALADTLRTAYDEKSLFPAYIREFEAKMKNFHTQAISQALSNTQPKHSQPKTRPSLQNIGLQLGAQMSSKSPKPQAAARQKGLAGLRLKPLPQSRRSSVTTES